MAVFTAIAIASLAAEGWHAYQQHKAGQEEKKAGQAEQQAANSQADLFDFNAKVAGLQAADALARGALDEQRYRTMVRGVVGSQRAAIASNHIDVGSGSALDVQADAAYLGELDALQIRTNAAREAWGFNVQSADLTKQAEIARKTGRYQAAAGNARARQADYAAVGSALGTGVSLLQQKYGFH